MQMGKHKSPVLRWEIGRDEEQQSFSTPSIPTIAALNQRC
jgi:hypothetical protein